MSIRPPLLCLVAGLIWLPLGAQEQPSTLPASDERVADSVPDERAEVPERAPEREEIDTSPIGRTPTVQQALERNLKSQQALRAQIDELSAGLNATPSQSERTQIETGIAELNEELDHLQENFENLAAGFRIHEERQLEDKDLSLSEELAELLQPLISEMRDWTEKPRQTEAIRERIAAAEERLELIARALAHLEEELARTEDPTLREALLDTRQQWTVARTQAQADITYEQSALESTTGDNESVFAAVGDSIGAFFRSRGLSLLAGVLAFGAVVLIFEWLRGHLRRVSPWHRIKHRSFGARLVEVAWHLATVILAFFAVLVVFYIANDWLLLGLTIILIVALLFTARNSLPRMMAQIRLLLNIGQAREGERVVFEGVPFLIDELSLFSTLKNPALDNGIVRLDMDHMLELVSRPIEDDDEPWFPSCVGDWMQLSGHPNGRVVVQTPEMVQLVQLGGARLTLPTADYLAAASVNLSQGFRLVSTFGIDYTHQPDCTDKIPQLLWTDIARGLGELVAKEELKSLKVEFASAAASSLDYSIIADFDGQVAARYEFLSRALQRLAVESCNQHGWVIPFTQITLHQALPPADPAPEAGADDEEEPRQLP